MTLVAIEREQSRGARLKHAVSPCAVEQFAGAIAAIVPSIAEISSCTDSRGCPMRWLDSCMAHAVHRRLT